MTSKTYKIAMILPSPFSGGVVRSLVNICRMLSIGARKCDDEVELIVGIPEEQELSLENKKIFSEMGIELRFFKQNVINSASLMGAYRAYCVDSTANSPAEFVYFDDGVINFEDADFWYIISDGVRGALPLHKKYACMVYDYANRYAPEIFNEAQWQAAHFRTELAAKANFVVTTTDQTRRDVINFAGVLPGKVHVFPLEFDPITLASNEQNEFDYDEYILWPTIISSHENHPFIIEGFKEFLEANDMKIIIIGKGTSSFDPKNKSPSVRHPYVENIRKLIGSSKLLKDRLIFLDYVSDGDLITLMKNAFCVLHTSRGDNGSYTIVEAAWMGTIALSNRYPAIEEVGRYFQLPLEYFDYYRPGSLTHSLRRLQHNRAELIQHLPSREVLKKYSYENLAKEYWEMFLLYMMSSLVPEHE